VDGTAVGLLVTGVSQTISLVRSDLKPVNVLLATAIDSALLGGIYLILQLDGRDISILLFFDCPFVYLCTLAAVALMNRSHRRLTLML